MLYKNKSYDEERALYGVKDADIENCKFEGPADGESALKETRGLNIRNCDFLLRYPLWHTADTVMENCTMTDCDLSFENSDVTARIKGAVTSVKNPMSGRICAGEIGEIIMDEYAKGSTCRIFAKSDCLKQCG